MIASSACASADTVSGREGTEYGRSQQLHGVAVNGFEVDAVTLCDAKKADCIAADNSDPQAACWNEWTPAASEQLMALTDGQAYGKYEYKSYWMEFTGRKTAEEGEYGHLGVYPCQVLVEKLSVYEALDEP